MRIAVTGALGHIGSRFIHQAAPGDFEEVLLLDDLSTQRYCSLFNLPRDVPFRFLPADIRQADLAALFEGLDAVVHLAAMTDAAGSFEKQREVEEVNFEGTVRVAKACALRECRLIFLSTTSVYGVQDHTVDEECPEHELKPQSPYAESKLRAERWLVKSGQALGLKFVTCRFGTIFGRSPGMRFHTAVNKFIWQASLGEPLTVWKTALLQNRPYLEIGDAVRALKHILRTDTFDNRVYNVVTLNTTVGRIVEVIRSFIPDARVQLVDSRIMNQLSYTVLSTRFEQLGFHFEGTLSQGIGETVELLRNVRSPAGIPDSQ